MYRGNAYIYYILWMYTIGMHFKSHFQFFSFIKILKYTTLFNPIYVYVKYYEYLLYGGEKVAYLKMA